MEYNWIRFDIVDDAFSTPVAGLILRPRFRSFFREWVFKNEISSSAYLISNWNYFVSVEWIHLSLNQNICRKMFSWSLFQKEGFEIWGFRQWGLRDWNEAEVFFRRAKLSRRDYMDYLKKEAKSGDMADLEIRFRVWASGKWFRRYFIRISLEALLEALFAWLC